MIDPKAAGVTSLKYQDAWGMVPELTRLMKAGAKAEDLIEPMIQLARSFESMEGKGEQSVACFLRAMATYYERHGRLGRQQ